MDRDHFMRYIVCTREHSEKREHRKLFLVRFIINEVVLLVSVFIVLWLDYNDIVVRL
jgi:hypothetical protein